MQSMRLTHQHCVGVTAMATHVHREISTYSDSPRSAPTNPLFSAFDLGGGRASNLAFTIGGDGDVKKMIDEDYNVKNGIKHL